MSQTGTTREDRSSHGGQVPSGLPRTVQKRTTQKEPGCDFDRRLQGMHHRGLSITLSYTFPPVFANFAHQPSGSESLADIFNSQSYAAKRQPTCISISRRARHWAWLLAYPLASSWQRLEVSKSYSTCPFGYLLICCSRLLHAFFGPGRRWLPRGTRALVFDAPTLVT